MRLWYLHIGNQPRLRRACASACGFEECLQRMKNTIISELTQISFSVQNLQFKGRTYSSNLTIHAWHHISEILANNVDPDQMPQKMMSDQDLH